MNPLRGISLKMASVIAFMIMSSLIKATSDSVPPGEQVFFRSFFAMGPLLGWMLMRHEFPAALYTSHPMGHVWRSLVGVAAMGCGFLGLGLLPLPEAVAIGFASPLLATIFAAMFLGETVRFYRMAAVALGLLGVTLVLSPAFSGIDPAGASKMQTVGAFASLLGAVFGALATVFIRKLIQVETSAAIVFYFTALATVMSLFTIPFGWVIPTAEVFGLLVLAGICGGFGQILMTSAYRHAETSVIAPFDYSAMIFALVIGYVFFDEVPEWITIAGATLVVSAGLLIIWRESQLGIERRRARKAMTNQG